MWNVVPVVVAVEAAVVAVVTAVADSEEWAGVEVQSVVVKVASEVAVHGTFELEHVVREQEPKIVNKQLIHAKKIYFQKTDIYLSHLVGMAMNGGYHIG